MPLTMEVQTVIEDKGKYLRIAAKGIRDGYDDIVIGAKGVYSIATDHSKNYVLMDCSELRYINISSPDAFNLVRFYEQELSDFKDVVISTIGRQENIEIMKFWESICEKRGYRFRAFPHEDQAQSWLEEQIEFDLVK